MFRTRLWANWSAMMDRHSWIFWSLRVGRLFGTEIRLSWMLPALAVMLMIQCGPEVGLVFFALLVFAVLLHEFGHVFAARWTGGGADEIILSPLGGLAMTQPGPGHLAQFLTAAAGPLVNLLICAAFFPSFYAPESLRIALNPFIVPVGQLTAQTLLVDLCLLWFAASYLLLLFNLLPIFPFDGGQMLQAALSSRLPAEQVFRGMIYASYAVAGLLMLAGLVLQISALIFLGAIILVINIVQSAQGGRHDFEEESFMGYDFSQGYTSLERSSGGGSPETRKSKWQRWKEDRQKQQAEQERERQLQDEAQLDALLAKVHEHGMDSLSFAEKRLLQRVSTKYRDRTKREP